MFGGCDGISDITSDDIGVTESQSQNSGVWNGPL